MNLLPHPKFLSGFSTNQILAQTHPSLLHVPLADAALGVHKTTQRTPHPLVTPPIPTAARTTDPPPPPIAWEALYPARSVNPAGAIPGGCSFYLSGPEPFAAALARGATDVILSYRMMLQTGWEPVRGGKLPGVFGGVGPLAYGCSGGRKEARCECFSLRLMWRRKCEGEVYAYLPPKASNTERLKEVPPHSEMKDEYGASVGRGAFSFQDAVGRWAVVAMRVKLNTVGVDDGAFTLWVDGEKVVHVEGLSFRDSPDARISGLHFQTFFGGHTEEWATPVDQRAWFADITGAIIA